MFYYIINNTANQVLVLKSKTFSEPVFTKTTSYVPPMGEQALKVLQPQIFNAAKDISRMPLAEVMDMIQYFELGQL
jgi:hypothetical protein